jgi:hypothetical protein
MTLRFQIERDWRGIGESRRSAGRKTARLTLMTILLCGCASAPSQRNADQLRAEQIARVYAVQSLGLPKSQVARMRADRDSFSLADERELTIQFYDLEVIRPNKDGNIWAMDGGFPSYFRITVDTQTWKVVDRYASPE